VSRNRYKRHEAGIREIAQSSATGAAALAAAQRMAGNANAVGDSTYAAANTTVTAGWANERRAGAVVREVTHHWRDSRDRVLLRVRDAMRVRSG
jgi:hypothetical protein